MSQGRIPLRLDGPLARHLRARIAGGGSQLVVFSNGLATDQTVWDGVLRHLPGHFSALLFDLPGVSSCLQESFDPVSCRSLAPFADHLLGLLDEIGVTRCAFVGHSVSGMIGALASIEAPERFERLIMINASPRYIDEPGYRGGFTSDALADYFHAMSTDYQAWVAGFAPVVIPSDAPDAVAVFARWLGAMRPDIAIAVARVIFGADMRALLKAVTVPVDIIQSRDDPAVPPDVGEYLHAHLRDSRLVWIDPAGHLPHLSAPDEIAPALWSRLANPAARP